MPKGNCWPRPVGAGRGSDRLPARCPATTLPANADRDRRGEEFDHHLLVDMRKRRALCKRSYSRSLKSSKSKLAGMYNLNDMPGPLQARGLCAPRASQGSTLSRKDAHRAKPNQAGIHPDQQQTSAKTVSDMFAPIETWDDKETKRVGRSLRRHVEKAIHFAKDTPFEQEMFSKETLQVLLSHDFCNHERVRLLPHEIKACNLRPQA
jgi:hypothetical protein